MIGFVSNNSFSFTHCLDTLAPFVPTLVLRSRRLTSQLRLARRFFFYTYIPHNRLSRCSLLPQLAAGKSGARDDTGRADDRVSAAPAAPGSSSGYSPALPGWADGRESDHRLESPTATQAADAASASRAIVTTVMSSSCPNFCAAATIAAAGCVDSSWARSKPNSSPR